MAAVHLSASFRLLAVVADPQGVSIFVEADFSVSVEPDVVETTPLSLPSRKVITHDVNGKLMTNSRGEPFAEPIYVDSLEAAPPGYELTAEAAERLRASFDERAGDVVLLPHGFKVTRTEPIVSARVIDVYLSPTGRGEIVLGKEGDDDFALRLPIVDATPAVAGLIGRPVWNDGFNLYLGRSAVARAVSGVLHFASADAIREAITADRLAVLRSRYDAAVAEAVAAYGAAWTGSPGKFHAANAEFRTRLAECDQLKAEIERLEAAETRAERP